MIRPASPLIARYPALQRLPRLPLVAAPTPVTRVDALAHMLWIKRDDLCADPLGGNKVRALEFLLGDARPGDAFVTVGAAGSTHALSVATYGARAGARVFVGRWRQVMNETARVVAERISEVATAAPLFRSPVEAYLWAATKRLRGARWIAAGGTTPLGILGHVDAGLELVAQIDAGLLPPPRCVVLPLGTGGTAAGLALAFAIAERPIVVVGVQVVPRVIARKGRVLRLAGATARLIERVTGTSVPRAERAAIRIARDEYGGAYGRETDAGRDAARRLYDAAAIAVDPTYAAKALAQALRLAADAPTLFWLTFDSRTLAPHDQTA